MAITFNGAVLTQPQARTAFAGQGLSVAPPAHPAPHTLAVLGPADQGTNAWVSVATASDIVTHFGVTGDLAQALALCLAPVAGLATAAAPIKAYNVNPTTVASGTMQSAGAVTQVTLTTIRSGAAANQIKWAVSAGTTVGYKVTLGDDYSGVVMAPQDNISLAVLSIWYSGTGTSPTVSTTDTSLTVAATTSDVGGTVSFSAGTTVQQVVNQINQFAGWNAALLDPNPSDLATALLDNISSVVVGTTSATATTVSANVTAVVRYLNSGTNPWVTAVRAAGATSLATTGLWVYASGGSTGTATTATWQAAYTALQADTDVAWVVPVSPSATEWAANDAHCQYMHSLGYGRTGVVGGAAGTTLAAAQSAIQGLAYSPYTAYLANGVQDLNAAGQVVTYAPYLSAARVAAMQSVLPLNEALTLKPIQALGLEQTFSIPAVDQFVAAGALVLKPWHGQFVIARGQTCASGNSAATADQQQLNAVNERFFLEQQLNALLATQFVGQPIVPTTESAVTAAIHHFLGQWAPGNTAGHPALVQAVPALSAIQVSISGTVISWTAPASVVLAADFVLGMLTGRVDTAA